MDCLQGHMIKEIALRCCEMLAMRCVSSNCAEKEEESKFIVRPTISRKNAWMPCFWHSGASSLLRRKSEEKIVTFFDKSLLVSNPIRSANAIILACMDESGLRLP